MSGFRDERKNSVEREREQQKSHSLTIAQNLEWEQMKINAATRIQVIFRGFHTRETDIPKRRHINNLLRKWPLQNIFENYVQIQCKIEDKKARNH